MKRFYIYVILFFSLIVISCRDEVLPYSYENISSVTSDYSGELLFKTQLRLAFGKAFANALKNIEFRIYIKGKSKENTTKYFNELLFSTLESDIVFDSKTFGDYVKEGIDDEIKKLFGDSLVDMVMKYDPMVTIKIPDIFYNTEWEIEKYSPIVYVKTINVFGVGNESYYLGYHFSGYQDKLLRYKKVEKYSIIIKYSEDYILVNRVSYLDIHNVRLYDLIPQIKNDCGAEIVQRVINNSKEYELNKKWVFIKKKALFENYVDHCELSNSIFVDSNCVENCKRDCIEKDSTYNTLISFSMRYDNISILVEKTRVLVENADILMLYNSFSRDGWKVIDKYLLAGLRKDDYVNRDISLNVDMVKRKYDEIGKVLLPMIDFKETIEKFPKGYYAIKLNHLLEKGWEGEKDDLREIEFFFIKSEDYISKNRIGIGKRYDLTDVYCSYYIEMGNEYFNYCTPPLPKFSIGGISSVELKY